MTTDLQRPAEPMLEVSEITRGAILSVDAIAGLSAKELPALALALAAAQSAVAARLADSATQPRDDGYLSVDEVATLLAVDPAWVYRRASRWSFAVKLSSKVLRIERTGLRRWLAQRRRA